MAKTLHDISQRAGVSAATVSRVINGKPGVSREITSKVRRAIEELNFAPQRRGRMLGDLQYRRVGVCITRRDALMKYSAEFVGSLFGVQAALAEQSLEMLLGEITGQTLPRFMEEGTVDGLIMAGEQVDAEVLAHVPERPRVWLTSHYEPGHPSALQGNEIIGQMAASYLLERGCRRLAFLDLSHANPAQAIRAEYFALTAQRVGAEVMRLRGQAFLAGDASGAWNSMTEVVEAQLESMLSQPQRPDGLLVPIEPIVGLVYRQLEERGLRPGRDVQVVVCGNNVPLIASLRPTPGVIDLGGESIGRAAVEQLLLRILQPRSSSRLEVAVRPRLIAGETVS